MSNYSEQKSNSQSGVDFKHEVNRMLGEMKERFVIKNFSAQVNVPHKGFKYDKQYLSNFVIQTNSNSFITVCGTNSFRSDRAKTSFYDIEGFKNNWHLGNRIIASVLVVSDDEKESSHFRNFRDKIQLGEAYCPASHLLTFSEFSKFLSEFESSLIEADVTVNEVEAEQVNQGRMYAMSGYDFEDSIVAKLNEPDLLSYANSRGDDDSYDILINILKASKISINDLASLEASNAIPLLKSGGKAKSDILISLCFKDGQKNGLTVSLKNTTQDRVTCHDYPYSKFSEVLGCENTVYDEYFKKFQELRSHERFEKYFGQAGVVDFSNFLQRNFQKLAEWVLMGKHDIENLGAPELQISNYIMIRKNGKTLIKSTEDYIKDMASFSKAKSFAFGVPFYWTYPSKQGGKRIQLKIPIVGI
jgi:hypothetical protein